MKRIVQLTVLIAAVFCSSARAQDLIVKKDGSIIKATVTEITENSVKYKKADNPDGPLYTISKENLTSINYANGQLEKFESEKGSAKKSEDEDDGDEPSEKSANPLLSDPQQKRTIEAIAKDVGEQLIRNCANGKIDNSSTEIFWDQTYKDAITNEVNISIITRWQPKWSEGSGKWIKGKIVIATSGEKRWIYQNDNGLALSGCPKGFKIKQ